MKFESRFNLRQEVWHITKQSADKFCACLSCMGGKIPLPDGKTLSCPRCAGKGVISYSQVLRYIVGDKMTVGQIRVQVGGEREDDEEQYMTHQTGVGSGSIYYGKDLYPSIAEAQSECGRRNLEPGKEWACIRCNPEFETAQYSGYNEWQWCPVHEQRTNHVDPVKANELIAQRKKANDEERESA
jgi:hypothetical protein